MASVASLDSLAIRPADQTAWHSTASPLDPLARQLTFAAAVGRGMIIGLTGPAGGEGSTTLARDLCRRLALGGAEQAVLLVDCSSSPSDDRYPRPDGYRDEADSDSGAFAFRTLRALRGDGLAVNAAGLGAAMAELRRRHSFVVLDLPPPLDDGLSLELARACDRVYLVVRAGQTPADQARRAVERLGSAPLEGVLLNHARPGLPGWLERLLS